MPSPVGCAPRTDFSTSEDGGHSPPYGSKALTGWTTSEFGARSTPYTIIAVGNRYRQDDGVGPWVGARLLEAGLEVVEVGDDLTRLLEGWSNADSVILFEAVCSTSKPGTIHYLEVGNQPLPAMFSRFSSHALNLAEAIELSRTLGTLPPRVLIFGIEGQRFGFGEGLGLEVEQAAKEVVVTILGMFASAQATPTV
jgi:hydrogenase maturation protease